MVEDFERCYQAVRARDRRFDGWFFTAVSTTGIYCRPSCPARTPARTNVRFYPSAAAAQSAGYRACLRCRPDASPGSPEWNLRADVVARAMRAIADGVVDREGVSGLAARLGYGARHIHRMLTAEVGAGPLALARAQRAQTARLLIETTALGMADIAFAAGFASVRQFNATVREVLGRSPQELRRRATRLRRPGGSGGPATWTPPGGGATTLGLRLPYRQPMAASDVLEFLGIRAVPGVETYADGTFTRSVGLPRGHAVVSLRPQDGHIAATLTLTELGDLPAAVARCRRLLDLDADPGAVDTALGEDPMLRPLVETTPGRRVAGTVDGFETAVRAVAGQQVSVAGARRVLGRFAEAAGETLSIALAAHCARAAEPGPSEPPGPSAPSGPSGPSGPPITRVFPSPAALLHAPDTALSMPATRRDALRSLARAVCDDGLSLEPGADPQEVTCRLQALRGIGPWTVSYVRLRALGDPDVFMAGDLGVRRALAHLGAPFAPPASLARAARWRPWRSYASMHLWALSAPRPEEAA
ncbi:MAG: helix-turn-helix domain-containing protein [Actinomycetota bacterium]|nr:helix-turn-helix domain-containing protein [Actinomycetota bacterium]